MSKSFADILTLIHENNVEMINFKMADAKGEYHQLTIPASSFSIDLIQKGINIDTETYSCVAANCGDAIFIPDMDSAVLDQGSIIPTVVISGALRYFSGDPAPVPTEKKQSNGKSFGIIALLCGGIALVLLIASSLFGCFGNVLYSFGYNLISVVVANFMPYETIGILTIIYSIITLLLNFAINAIILLLGIIGVIFGIVGIKKAKASGISAGAATAGLVLGIVSVILSCMAIIMPLVTVVLEIILDLLFSGLIMII